MELLFTLDHQTLESLKLAFELAVVVCSLALYFVR